MTSIFTPMVSAILPVLSIAAVGYVISRIRPIDSQPLATVSIYILLPALVFHSLVTTQINAKTTGMFIAGVILFTGIMACLGEGLGRGFNYTYTARNGLVLTSSFPNVGNFGIPFMAFAFGALGRSAAVLFVIGQSAVMYTLGVYIASRSQTVSFKSSLVRIFQLPLLYATVAGIIGQYLEIVPPTESTIMQTVKITGDAAIPIMLLLLGIELANVKKVVALRRVVPGVFLKLMFAPVVAAGIVFAFGLSGTIGRVFILEGAMPTAITPLALSIQFGNMSQEFTTAEYVGTAVLVTTILSIFTLSVLLLLVTSVAEIPVL